MFDPRLRALAKVVVDWSVFVKKDERVIISSSTEASDLVKEIYLQVLKKGAYPDIQLGIPGLSYQFFKHASEKQLRKFPKIYEYVIKHTQKYIGIGADVNTREFSNINPKRLALRGKVTHPITDYIVNAKPKIYRCSMDFPTNALAQDAEMSLDEYEDFYFNACLLDWKKLSPKFQKLADKLNKVKEFRIVSQNTDLTMRIHKGSFVIDDGKENMPGGEVFGAPEKFSATGHIKFTFPAIRDGVEVTNIFAEFKEGKCIKATADKNQNFLLKMFDMDKGSRYIGEIGIGMNPKVNRFTKNLLFDEKIQKSIHLAFGMAYKECGVTNQSALHWDIVKDMSQGKIYLDGKIGMRNGKWLV